MLTEAGMSVELIFGALLAGTVATALLARWTRLCGWVGVLAIAAAAGFSVPLGAAVFGTGGVELDYGAVGAVPASLALHFSPLTMIFVWMILGLGLVASVYSVGYVAGLAHEDASGPTSVTLRYWPAFMLFLASMVAVVCVSDMLFFFLAWSLMMLPAFGLIIHNRRRPEVMRAGLKFLAFSIVGNLGIFAAVAILYQTSGDFSFAGATGAMSTLLATRPWLAHLAFGLLALGFLTKLGIYPMGDWLPDAHPAAPSPVSALLSGVMIKLGAYDIAHLSIALLAAQGASPGAMMAWGLGLAALGGLSVLLGGAAAAGNDDTKRLLAYSSVGQSGYILMCLGISAAFMLTNPALAGLAFVAAMVFIIADGVHKSLLFLTAGSVLHATGTRDLVQLGGLGDRMPSTSLAAIVGGLSVGGIPLTAGFLGKWLLFQATLLGAPEVPILAVYLLVVVVGSILSLAYALKYVGAAYLGAPATPIAAAAREVPASMRLPQVLLAVVAVAGGLWPALLVRPALAAWELTAPVSVEALGGGALLVAPGGALAGAFVSPVVLALVAIAGLMAWGLLRLGGAPTRTVPSWQSGLDLPLAQTRLPASGWYWPFTPILRRVYRELPFPSFGTGADAGGAPGGGAGERHEEGVTPITEGLRGRVRGRVAMTAAGGSIVLLTGLLLLFGTH